MLQSLKNYIKSVYCPNYSVTLYFQIQLLKLKGTENIKGTIETALKSERKKIVLSLKKIYNQEPEMKMQGAKERYYRDPESRR